MSQDRGNPNAGVSNAGVSSPFVAEGPDPRDELRDRAGLRAGRAEVLGLTPWEFADYYGAPAGPGLPFLPGSNAGEHVIVAVPLVQMRFPDPPPRGFVAESSLAPGAPTPDDDGDDE